MSANRRSTEGGDRKRPAKDEFRGAEKKPANKTEVRKEAKSEGKKDEKLDTKKDAQPSKREVERIVGVTDDNGELEFGIKFKGLDNMELIPARVANLEYPQQIIKYYEKRLVWESREATAAKATAPIKKNRNA